MKSDIILFQTKDNNYLYLKSNKQIHILNRKYVKVLENYIKSKSIIELNLKREEKYYFKKLKYLQNIGYLEEKEPLRINNRFEAKVIDNYLADSYRIVFEVTENCNLKCKYCGYGEFYTTHGIRGDTNLDFKTAKAIIDFFFEKWKSKQSLNHKGFNRLIQFYGGEPLLNFKVIKQIVEYTDKLDFSCKYGMTTNGMLLEKYMDFLVQHNFSLLLSLDGPELNNKFRVTKNNKNSFNLVFNNFKKLQVKYPSFFKEKVRFNCVLNSTSNLDEISDFFISNFDKRPEFSEITLSGIAKEKKEEFNDIFKSRSKCLEESVIETNHILEKDPIYNDFVSFLFDFSPLFFYSYNQLLNNQYLEKEIQTGSCRPFVNRIYVTSSGKILHCNFIEPKYILGIVKNGKVVINNEGIADIYNNLLNEIDYMCRQCQRVYSCRSCLFLDVGTINNKVICDQFLSKKKIQELLEKRVNYFEENRELYSYIKNNLRLI